MNPFYEDICLSIIDYFNYDTNTLVMIYQATLLTFPSVAVCNLNPFESSNPSSKSVLQSYIQNNGLSPNIKPSNTTYSIALVQQAQNILKAASLGSMNTNETFVKDLGFSLEFMLISCFYNGQQCDASDFKWFYSYDYGNCYVFNRDNGSNADNLKKISRSGPSNGLKLELFAGVPGEYKL
jgi:hypothetical protein